MEIAQDRGKIAWSLRKIADEIAWSLRKIADEIAWRSRKIAQDRARSHEVTKQLINAR